MESLLGQAIRKNRFPILALALGIAIFLIAFYTIGQENGGGSVMMMMIVILLPSYGIIAGIFFLAFLIQTLSFAFVNKHEENLRKAIASTLVAAVLLLSGTALPFILIKHLT